MDLEELIKRISQHGLMLADDGLSEIERDIMLADLRSLYLLVKGSTSTVIAKDIPTITLTNNEEAAPVEIDKEPEISLSDETVAAPAETEIIRSITEPEQKKPAVAFIPVVNLSEIHEEPKARPAASIKDIFMGEDKSLNEKLSANSRPALNDQAAQKDIKSLIDLNKQFVITNELFKGDGLAFQAAIDRINVCANVEAAFDYIKTDLIPRYQWSSDMQSARLFDKLVRMKFGV